MTLPGPWRDRAKIRRCRPGPGGDAPALIPDSKAGQLDTLLHTSGVLEVVEAELGGRPGPAGLPLRTVLVGLLLSLHYTGSATLADASRVLLDQLRPRAKDWFAVPDLDEGDVHGRIAFTRRVYRAFDRLTTALDPHRTDRRRRLPPFEAAAAISAWEDDKAEHVRRRAVLQQISDRLVLIGVRLAYRRGMFTDWPGDVGVDTTSLPTWARPPSRRCDLASVEPTAGWHFSGGASDGIFGHSATLLVAASRRHPAEHPRAGQRTSRHPQLALGLVLDTPGKRIGPDAIHTLKVLADTEVGLGPTPPVGLLAADRAYTNQTPEHFAIPARRLGYRLSLDYNQADRGLQGTHHGALLIDGALACPHTPAPYVHATSGLDDDSVRASDDQQLTQLIAAREAFYLPLKQAPDLGGTLRLQCPAAGPSPHVTCPRYQRLHHPGAPPAQAVDLTSLRAVRAHTAAKPPVPIPPAEHLRPQAEDELPLICRQPTITIRPGDLGPIEKFRQDRHYLTPAWADAYKVIRANTEAINGRAKAQVIDLSDPKRRLARGRAAQALLVALMICTLNLQIIAAWQHTRGDHTPLIPSDEYERRDGQRSTEQPPATPARPPPAAPPPET